MGKEDRRKVRGKTAKTGVRAGTVLPERKKPSWAFPQGGAGVEEEVL